MSLSGTDLPTSILFCRLCQSLYRNPRTLPCLHSFCDDCLGQLKPTRDATGEAVSLTCPVCNQAAPLPPASGVGGFVANDFLARMCHEYVGEVQRTLVTSANRPASPATSGSPRGGAGGGGGLASYSSTTLVGTGSYFQKPEQQQQQQAHGYYGYQTQAGGYQAQAQPLSPASSGSGSRFDYAFRSSRMGVSQASPAPGATAPPTLSSTYSLQPTAAAVAASRALSPPRHSSSTTTTSSTSSEAVLQTARRLSSEGTPSRGVGVGRRLSSTPRHVVRTWECLQRKLNGLHAASLQATYSLETINMHESNWHQRKQDLRRDIQRRSAQLQFFIKRQERLLLAALDSRGTDERFTAASDRARADVRQNLKALMHEIDTLRSVLDLATDSELLSLSALLLSSTVPQTEVGMETPELRFVVPGDISLEDMVSRDFGCLTSTMVSNVIFTPENIEQVLPEEEVEEDEDDEAFVTDTYTMDTPYPYSYTPPSASVASSASSAYTTTTTTDRQATTASSSSTTIDACDQNNTENVAFIDDDDDDEAAAAEDEDEDEDEEVVVEETFEIIDGKMTVVSKKSYPTRKPLSPRGSSRTSSAASSPRRREENEEEKRGSARSSLRLTTTSAATTTAGGEAGASQRSKDVSPRGRATETRRTVNSSPTTANVPSTFTATTTTREQTQTQQQQQRGTGMTTSPTTTTTTTMTATKPAGERRPSEEPRSPPPEQQHQRDKSPRTLENFQQVREELRQKRRELLANASVFALPHHPEVAYLVSSREKRVHSLDRRASGPTALYRSHSPASPRERQPSVAAPLIHTPRHSSDSEDSVHSEPWATDRPHRPSSGGGAGGGGIVEAGGSAGRGIFRHERSASGGSSSSSGVGVGVGLASFGAATRAQASFATTTASTLGVPGGGGGVHVATSSFSATSPPASPSAVLTTANTTTTTIATSTTGAADRAPPSGSRPVRRAISAASDRASKMEYLRETWRRRKELLIQNEAFTPAPATATTTTTAPHAEPEDDIEAEGGNEEMSSSVESKESDKEASSSAGDDNKTAGGSSPGTGHHQHQQQLHHGDGKSSSKIKQSIRSRITNLKHALKKNGSKGGGGGGEEGKQPDSAKSPEKKRGAELSLLSSLSPTTGRRPAVLGSVYPETPAEQKVLKTVDSILQKRNVPIPDPSNRPSPLSPSKSLQISSASAPLSSTTTTSTTQASSPGSSKPSLMVRPSPRDPLPSPATTSSSSSSITTSSSSSAAAVVVPSSLETLAEDDGSGGGGGGGVGGDGEGGKAATTTTTTTPSPSRKISSLRPTSPDTSKEKIQQVKAIMRRKKERWRSLSLT